MQELFTEQIILYDLRNKRCGQVPNARTVNNLEYCVIVFLVQKLYFQSKIKNQKSKIKNQISLFRYTLIGILCHRFSRAKALHYIALIWKDENYWHYDAREKKLKYLN